MLELKFEDKVRVWRDLRVKMEDDPCPFSLLLDFLGSLPVSSRKTNPFDPDTQIQPWNLIGNESFTEYEIAQLCAYTLQLTDRFCESKVEIHISKDIEDDRFMYLVYLDNSTILGYGKEAVKVEKLPKNIISQKVYALEPLH